MTRILKFLAIALLALFMVAPVASAQRFGGGFRGGFHGGFHGGFRGGFGFFGPGFYGPGWWSYGWGPYWGPYDYDYAPSLVNGEVKIETPAKDVMVYVDGAYAGLSGKLRHFHLAAGQHDIELRDPSGHTFYQEKINVFPGKTIEIGGK